MQRVESISGQIVDVLNETIYSGTIIIEKGRIKKIRKEKKSFNKFILPGFIDSYIRTESSLLTPSEFARVAVTHGTVSALLDTCSITSILGLKGIRYLSKNSGKSPFKFYFSSPACLPMDKFEMRGAKLEMQDLEKVLRLDEVRSIEGVLNFKKLMDKDSKILDRLNLTRKHLKVIDSYCPGISGSEVETCIKLGIGSDRGCKNKEEAIEKIKMGMKIKISGASVNGNFKGLSSLLHEHPDSCMFCSSDISPDLLNRGHINKLVKGAISEGIDVMKVLKTASVNPVLHYDLDLGLLRVEDPADFIVVDNLDDLLVLQTVINGEIVSLGKKSLIKQQKPKIRNVFKTSEKQPSNFALMYKNSKVKVIEAVEKKIDTEKLLVEPKVETGYIVSDIENDILKIAVVNRYQDEKPVVGLIKGFGLKKGAMASSIAFDSHNVVCVGVSDNDIATAVNLIIRNKGGLSVASAKDNVQEILPLPVAGLMSDLGYELVSQSYSELEAIVKSFGSRLVSPFTTLSYMTLLDIPKLKMSDKGLIDTEKFELVDVYEKTFSLVD